MSNKRPATEEEIGELHKLLTNLHNLKLDAMLQMAEKFIELGAVEAILEIINSKDLAVTQKWVEYNGVSAIAAAQNGETELAKKLRLLKKAQEGKVVQFRETGSE